MVASVSVRAPSRAIGYWVATGLVCGELVAGGIWDILRIPLVRDVVVQLGYPLYFLIILGIWKLLGAAALLAPRYRLLKEWAYAGVVFADTGAIASHLITGTGYGELAILIPLAALTVASWALRPPDRRVSGSS